MSKSKIVRYQASSPRAQYLGSNLKGFTDNLHADVVQPILEKFKVKEIVPNEWMDAQLQLDMLREIESKCTFEQLVAVGMKAAEFVPIPPELNTLEKFVEFQPILQQMLGRHMAAEERVYVEKLDSCRYRVILNIPAPPFAMFGYLHGLIRRIKQPGQYPIIIITEAGTPYVFEFKW